MRLTEVLRRVVSCGKRLVDFVDDSSRRCVTISVLMAVLADLGLPLRPLFSLVTRPISLNSADDAWLWVCLEDFFPESQSWSVPECGLPILIQYMLPRSLLSPPHYIAFDPLEWKFSASLLIFPKIKKEIFVILEIVRIQKVVIFYWFTLYVIVRLV